MILFWAIFEMHAYRQSVLIYVKPFRKSILKQKGGRKICKFQHNIIVIDALLPCHGCFNQKLGF